jgi:hypothetical protein
MPTPLDSRVRAGHGSEVPCARSGHSHPLVLASVICLLALVSALIPSAPAAATSGDASAAAGFIESAQNKDGGFGPKRSGASNPQASLWAAAALLAAGRNPADESLKNATSLDDYLAAHASAYVSLSNLGLLTLVQSAATGSSSYGDPGAKLEDRLTPQAARQDPTGGALAILGLLALGTPAAREVAGSAAQSLLGSPTPDGGWGSGGLSDSASTALVLQALAASGAASAQSSVVVAGVAYLHKAQANDGSIAASIRTDQAIASGSVTATAFTIQALNALGEPSLRTPTGKTVLQGLAQYQQRSSGGLTSDGSLYSQVPPSVTETAEAFAAFDGITFPLARVARQSTPRRSSSATTPAHSNHVSSGTAAQGVSNASGTGADQGAFKQGSAAPTPTRGAAHPGSSAARKHASHRSASGQGPVGTSVSGEVVGQAKPAKLVAAAGQKPGGLTSAEKATLSLAGLLLACLLLGAALDARRPRTDGRSTAAIAVAGAAALLAGARGRGSLAPFAVLLVGFGLIVFPLATHMLDRAPKGEQMIKAFKPYMQSDRLTSYESEVKQLDEGFAQGGARGPGLLSPHASRAAQSRRFAAATPELIQFEKQWPSASRTLTTLIHTIRFNRTDYQAVAALPRFSLFPWFFIVPGALLALLAAAALAVPGTWRPVRWAILALGIALLAAPLAFGMWSRAPKGAELVSAFRTVETRRLVTAVQGDFATVTTGEGSLSGELLPALEGRGLSTAAIDRAMPAVAQMEGHWIQILQSLTPMIGVMSDNVRNYQAVAALPAFTVFPWLFLAAGLLLLALLAVAATGGRLPMIRRSRAIEPQAA